MKVGFKTPFHWVDWATLEDIWRTGGQIDVFDSAWTMDHLELGDGPVWESWTGLAALAHLVPGKTIGHIVAANPFRHPAVLAKMSTVLDHVTGGNFVLGIGSGSWPAELQAFGLSEATDADRLRDLEAALRVIRAMFGRDGADPLGAITLDAPPYRLTDARNDPPPLTPGGPPIWLGTQGERVGPRLVAQLADGWNFSPVGGGPELFRRKREILFERCAEFGRDPSELTISAQMLVDDHGAARDTAFEYAAEGCEHLALFIDPRRGAAEVEKVARAIAEPLRAAVTQAGRPS